MSTSYRNVLYANYHTTQSGRASKKNKQEQFETEKTQFKLEILPHLLSLPKEAAICDIGCGSGSMLSVLQEQGFNQAVGVDISPEQVAFATEMGVKNVHCADVFDFLEQHNLKCHAFIGLDIIEHFTKDELVAFLQKLKSNLLNGGFVVFRTPNMDAFMPSVFASGDFTHEVFLNQSSAEQLLMACGFSHVQVSASHMRVANPVKELIRRCVYTLSVLQSKIKLFASARSTRGIVFTPNIIIKAKI